MCNDNVFVCLQLTVGSFRFVVGHLAYYFTWLDNPENQKILIAGVVGGGGGLILLIVIAVVVLVCVRRRKKRRRERQRQPSSTERNIYTQGILSAHFCNDIKFLKSVNSCRPTVYVCFIAATSVQKTTT